MNKRIYTLLKYECFRFIRNRFQLALLGMLVIFSLYAIYYGISVLQAQKQTIQKVSNLEAEEFHQYQASFEEELSSLEAQQRRDIAADPAFAWYRHGYHAILPPDNIAALSIGQRDLYPYYYRLTGMSLHYQLFQNEIANPLKLYVGNFDLSFVIIYFFPLIIIAFTYNLYSGEQESGVLPLLQIQPLPIQKVLFIRLCFYFVILTGLMWLLSLIALWLCRALMQDYFAALLWLATLLAYGLFWFSLMYFLITFRQNSAFNAISAIGVWLFFLVIIPAVLNIIATQKYPVNTTTLAGLVRRTSLENEDDEQEAKAVLEEFFEHFPKYAETKHLIDQNLLSKTYAAFTTLKDVHSEKAVKLYQEKVKQRNQWLFQYRFISPASNTQVLFNQIAHTDFQAFLEFQQGLKTFHAQISGFYFKKLFWNQKITVEDYQQMPHYKLKAYPNNTSPVFYGILSLLGISFFFLGIARLLIKYTS